MASPKKYEHINFTPPVGVANAAEKGLTLRAKASPSNRGGLTPSQASEHGIGSGVQRAVNLKNRNTVSPKVVKQMKAFFARHEKNKGIKAENKGTPWNDKGYVAWLLWGGDPGKSWSEKIVGQMGKADEKEKSQKKASTYNQKPTNIPNFKKERNTMKSLVQRVASKHLLATHGGHFIDRSTKPSTMYITDGKVAIKLETGGRYKGKFVPCMMNEMPSGMKSLPSEKDWNGILVSGNAVSEIASILRDPSYDVVAPSVSEIKKITFSNPFDPKEEWKMLIGIPQSMGEPTGIPSLDKKGADNKARELLEKARKVIDKSREHAYVEDTGRYDTATIVFKDAGRKWSEKRLAVLLSDFQYEIEDYDIYEDDISFEVKLISYNR